LDNSEKIGDKTSSDLDRLNSDIQSLLKESETRNNLLKIVAHDLLSPASAISGLTKLLLKRDDAANFTERQLAIVQTMDRAMDHYLRILQNIMELSKILRHKLPLSPADIPVKPSIDRIVECFQAMANQKGIALESEYHGDDHIFADEKKLEETLARLVNNGLMFSPRGGRVVVACRSGKEQVEIEVKDNGVGIDKDRIETIFLMDGKCCTFGTDGEKGSGMSLCIAKNMARLSGGDLEIESRLGEGTIARLKLPKQAK